MEYLDVIKHFGFQGFLNRENRKKPEKNGHDAMSGISLLLYSYLV